LLRLKINERRRRSGRLYGLWALSDAADARDGRDRSVVARGFAAFRPAPAFAIAARRKRGQRIADHSNQEKTCDYPLCQTKD